MQGIVRLAAVAQSAAAMAEALPDLPQENTLAVRLIRILSASLSDYYEPVFRKVGLTENQYHILCLLMAAE